MPEVAQTPEGALPEPPAEESVDDAASAAVQQTFSFPVAPGASRPQRVSLPDAAYDVPVAALEVISMALRRYGPELLALTGALAVCRYLLGLPALALGAAAWPATYFARSLVSRIRR